MLPADVAVSRFTDGLSCSQAVFSAYAARLGLDEPTALKIAAGFGGGMGRMAETCGAVTGAFMVLGLRFGPTSADREAKDAMAARIRDFAGRFKARNSTITCRDLLGYDISTPAGHQAARDKGLLSTICPKVVRDACEILNEMLEER
jgi:C_GCAxxG_C_C family probable redox protein